MPLLNEDSYESYGSINDDQQAVHNDKSLLTRKKVISGVVLLSLLTVTSIVAWEVFRRNKPSSGAPTLLTPSDTASSTMVLTGTHALLPTETLTLEANSKTVQLSLTLSRDAISPSDFLSVSKQVTNSSSHSLTKTNFLSSSASRSFTKTQQPKTKSKSFSRSRSLLSSQSEQVTATVTIDDGQVVVSFWGVGAFSSKPVEIFNGPISCLDKEKLYEAIVEILPAYDFSVGACEALFKNTTNICKKLMPCNESISLVAGNITTGAVNVTGFNNTNNVGAFWADVTVGCNARNFKAGQNLSEAHNASRLIKTAQRASQKMFSEKMRLETRRLKY